MILRCLDHLPWPTKAFAALPANWIACACACVRLRLHKDAVVSCAALEPGGEGFLIRECAGFHRAEFGHEEPVVRAAYTEDNECPRVADHCRPYDITYLLGELRREGEVECKLSRFTEQ